VGLWITFKSSVTLWNRLQECDPLDTVPRGNHKIYPGSLHLLNVMSLGLIFADSVRIQCKCSGTDRKCGCFDCSQLSQFSRLSTSIYQKATFVKPLLPWVGYCTRNRSFQIPLLCHHTDTSTSPQACEHVCFGRLASACLDWTRRLTHVFPVRAALRLLQCHWGCWFRCEKGETKCAQNP
jgi:hypothetical protein